MRISWLVIIVVKIGAAKQAVVDSSNGSVDASKGQQETASTRCACNVYLDQLQI